jgi:beta-alanine degradation protein BauB
MSFNSTVAASSTVRLNDSAVSITQWDFPVGAATGWHEHEWPYIVVMLTDGKLRLHDGNEMREVSLVAGQSYRRPAGIKHDVMNGSDHPISFVEIEIKNPVDLLTV